MQQPNTIRRLPVSEGPAHVSDDGALHLDREHRLAAWVSAFDGDPGSCGIEQCVGMDEPGHPHAKICGMEDDAST
jgi:hypothetical protein